MRAEKNPVGLRGIDFIEYSSPQPEKLVQLWEAMGFVFKGRHREKPVDLFSQGHTFFILNQQKNSFAEHFFHQHGPSVCALAFRVRSAKEAFKHACSKGAKPVPLDRRSHSFPAIYGVGESVIYFVEEGITHFAKEFDCSSSHSGADSEVSRSEKEVASPFPPRSGNDSEVSRSENEVASKSPPRGGNDSEMSRSKNEAASPSPPRGGNDSEVSRSENEVASKSPPRGGLVSVDHLTHNVPAGDMQKWCDFYQEVFNFTERRYFDIQGSKTGLVSKVMRSPCNTITIPINEPAKGERGKKSQIQEFLEEYKGSGIQHIALSSQDIVSSVKALRAGGIAFLDVPDTYYEDLPRRVPQVEGRLKALREHKVLADGDERGYLLQIFTKNVIGPVFYEIISRHGHDGFGEGNFQALFDAIERDQIQRGYLS